MAPRIPEHSEREFDALLRRRRPAPDSAWVHSTGERLFPPARARRPSGLRLGAALAVALAALTLVLSLAGVGPLSSDGDGVEAADDCTTVAVTRTRKVPAVVTGPGGNPRIVTVHRPVRRFERRCR